MNEVIVRSIPSVLATGLLLSVISAAYADPVPAAGACPSSGCAQPRVIRSYAMPREIKEVPILVAQNVDKASTEVDNISKEEEDDLPLGRDELFGTVPDAPMPGGSDDSGAGVDALSPGSSRPASFRNSVRGFVDFTPAYTYASPGHWSRAVARTQVEARGSLGASAKWKASLRLDTDPVYYGSDSYPSAVKEDQRFEFLVRETYLDLALPSNWELRLGRQHVVWGEAVSLFFADVVSARDMRDLILPEFDILRIPQWAARAEYFGERMHFELLWIPFPSYDNIGKPGAEFYPFHPPEVPGFQQVMLGDNRPANTLENTNYGARVSGLINGWDLSGFYYRSNSVAPTLYRQVELAPTPTVYFEPRHDRIWQLGGTLAKDFGSVVLKGEAVYTQGRHYEVTTPTSSTGTVKQNTLDYLIGLDFILPKDGRLNLQAFQRVYFDHHPDILFDEFETGFSVLIGAKLLPKLEPQLLYIQSLNSSDRMLRPRVNWYVRPDLRLSAGVDIFDGPDAGLFGRFDGRDRVYGEVRYTF